LAAALFATVKEEGESWFMNCSSRRGAARSHDDVATGATLEHSLQIPDGRLHKA
jgi:hypothetical protein